MPTNAKDMTAEIVADVADAKTAFVAMQSALAAKNTELADARAQLGNFPDEDVTAIRAAFTDLKTTYSPSASLPASPPAPQPAPNPPTN